MKPPFVANQLKAVLFDLDGTLLHTAPDLAAAVNAMLVDLGHPVRTEAEVATFVGKGADNLIHRALTGHMSQLADSELFARAKPLWQKHYHRVNGQLAQAYPGVESGLKRLKQAGLRLGVVTNKPEAFTLPLLQLSGLQRFFDVVVGGDTCTQKKPHPMPYLHACAQLEVPVHQSLMIGDSVNDVLAARAAGSWCWLLPYGYNEGVPIEQTDCDARVQTLDEAADLILASR